jgi:hypothetical protein
MNKHDSDTPSSSDEFIGPTANSLKQLAGQLSQWRGMLPRALQWAEDDPVSFPSPQPTGGINQTLDPILSPSQHGQTDVPLFTADLDSDPVRYPYVYDIHVALLRTRYYYAKYMVYRPFIYKALHFPEQMTQDDAEGVAECLRVRLIFLLPYHWQNTDSQAGLLKMANRSLPNISTQKTNTLSLLLVPEFPRYTPHIPYD